MRRLALALLLLAVPARGWAAAPADPIATTSALCNTAIAAVEQMRQTPPNLLGTMAKVESGRPIPSTGRTGPWPWAIDADGQAYFFDTKAEAVAWTKAALARGVRYLDAGCLQIDLPLHPTAFRSIEDAFDPLLNAAYAARFLRQLYDGDARGSWPVAVGYYHSHTPYLAEEYRSKVASVGADILGGVAGTAPPLYYRALQSGTLHIALAGGGMLILHTGRQPARVHRHLSPCQIAAVLGDYLRSPPKGASCRTASR
ncbi:MAG TPA: hypothetical protein VHS58_00615 [Acetobacteraceae bacterium]|nr:hypothetical protein [Acetobacteraceae bacterium]